MYAMDQQHQSSMSKVKNSTNLTGIPTQMKRNLESRSGLSFDDVRVHYHSAEPAKIGALAYTRGTQVHIGPGQERHLQHELGHVIQQKKGLVRPTTWINGLPVNDSPELERSAIHCVNEQIAQNGKDGIASETHFSPNTDQHVLQMMTGEEQTILLGWFICQYKLESPPKLTAKNTTTMLMQFATADKDGTQKAELEQILREFYNSTSKFNEKTFEDFLNSVRYHSAQRIIRAHMNKKQGKSPTVAVVFGDKAFTTAKALQKRGFEVYSTALETVSDEQDSDGKFKKRVEKMFQRDKDHLLHLYQGIALTENGGLTTKEHLTTNANENTNWDVSLHNFETDHYSPFADIPEWFWPDSPLLADDELVGPWPDDSLLYDNIPECWWPDAPLIVNGELVWPEPDDSLLFDDELTLPTVGSPSFFELASPWSRSSIENSEENEQTDTSVTYNPDTDLDATSQALPPSEFSSSDSLEISHDLDQFNTAISKLGEERTSRGLCVFDHPYTTGSYIDAAPTVHELCKNFFAFARNHNFGRAQMTVRVINAPQASDKRKQSRLSVYELVHPGFLIYRIQRSSAKVHKKTSGQSKLPDIVPTEQSLVLKYVNLEVMFPKLCEYAKLAHDNMLQEDHRTLICEAISALQQSRYCPIDLLGYDLSSENEDSIFEFLNTFWLALEKGKQCSELEQKGANIIIAHPPLAIDDEHSDIE